MAEVPFWRRKKLKEMTRREWESLCDGCARCCLHKLEDEETGVVSYTRVACRLLDMKTCRCSDYTNRTRFVSDCIRLSAGNVERYKWLPATCAYRLLAEGRDLPGWHPLVSGDPDSVHSAGISIRDRAVPEALADDLEDFIVDWPDKGE